MTGDPAVKHWHRFFALAFTALLLAGGALRAQAPTPSPSPAPGADQAGNEQTIDQILAGEEEVLSGEGYSYDPAGRRDPFVSLLARTQNKQSATPRPEGVPGLLIDEIDVQGIFQLKGRWFAQVQTSNKEKSYLIQEGDHLYDGDVVSITRNEVTFKQVVNDPSVIKPFREVVKKLNPES